MQHAQQSCGLQRQGQRARGGQRLSNWGHRTIHAALQGLPHLHAGAPEARGAPLPLLGGPFQKLFIQGLHVFLELLHAVILFAWRHPGRFWATRTGHLQAEPLLARDRRC